MVKIIVYNLQNLQCLSINAYSDTRMYLYFDIPIPN